MKHNKKVKLFKKKHKNYTVWNLQKKKNNAE